MTTQKVIKSLGLDSIHFVSSIEVIEAGNVITSIDFTKKNDLKLIGETPKKRRGRPKLTEEQKAFNNFKREAGKTRRFSIGEEPNKRAAV